MRNERDAALDELEAIKIEKQCNWEGIDLHYQQKISQLQKERDTLKVLLAEINSRVIPGERDSTDALTSIFKERDAVIERVEKVVIEAAKTLRIHGNDLKKGTHATLLWAALDDLEKLK